MAVAYAARIFLINAFYVLLSVAQVSAQNGKLDYQKYCALCHGADGKGGKQVRFPGPSLANLSKKNGDRFPFQRYTM
jgi:cytochrome c553